MNQKLQVIMTSEEVNLALQRIALQILEKNQPGKKLAIVGIHTCGVFLAERWRGGDMPGEIQDIPGSDDTQQSLRVLI